MARPFLSFLGFCFLFVPLGCATDGEIRAKENVQAGVKETDEGAHVGPPIESVRDVMAAKLAHAHGVLEGLARQNYRQIIANAESLNELAKKSSWQVHRTMEYNLFSDEFRWHTRELKRHAELKNVHAATLDYMQMVMTCVRCHDYMAQENLVMEEPFDLTGLLVKARSINN